MATAQQFTTEQLCEALKYHFAHDEFRPFQLEAIQATLSGRDSLLILPTGEASSLLAPFCWCAAAQACSLTDWPRSCAGGGKTLTFQLPALAKSNCFTVVVGPLMALAKDQVRRNVLCAVLSGLVAGVALALSPVPHLSTSLATSTCLPCCAAQPLVMLFKHPHRSSISAAGGQLPGSRH